MSSNSPAVEDYSIACEMNECRWEHRRSGTSKWEPFSEAEHKVIETAHILKEKRAQIKVGGTYGSRVIVDLKDRTYSRGYGHSFEVRRMVLYSPAEILARKNAQLVQQFIKNKPAKKFADELFEKFKNEPDSNEDEDEDEEEPTVEVIEDNLVDFLNEIGVDETTIQPAILFWQMNVKGFMEVTRDELYLFLQKAGPFDLGSFKGATSKLTELIKNEDAFAHFYFWNFDYYRNAQEGQKKFIAVKTAAQVWAQILVPRYPEVLKHLGGFMTEYKGLGISLDTWKMMRDFSKNTKPDLSNMADFYPPFIDEFVEYLVEKHGYKNPNAEEEEDDGDDDFF